MATKAKSTGILTFLQLKLVSESRKVVFHVFHRDRPVVGNEPFPNVLVRFYSSRRALEGTLFHVHLISLLSFVSLQRIHCAYNNAAAISIRIYSRRILMHDACSLESYMLK